MSARAIGYVRTDGGELKPIVTDMMTYSYMAIALIFHSCAHHVEHLIWGNEREHDQEIRRLAAQVCPACTRDEGGTSAHIYTAIIESGREGHTAISARARGGLYSAIYQRYITPRLVGAHPGEEAVREWIAAGDVRKAVETWFELVGPDLDLGHTLSVVPSTVVDHA